MKIDLGPLGPAGIEATFRDGVLFIRGSDHWRDWIHHVTPGANYREEKAAIEIYNYLSRRGLRPYKVAGHSLGGNIAMRLAYLYRSNYKNVTCLLYAPKRVPAKWHTIAKVYRHRGDIVPFLPPWRKAYTNVKLIGERKPFWRAHEPKEYYVIMAADGVR